MKTCVHSPHVFLEYAYTFNLGLPDTQVILAPTQSQLKSRIYCSTLSEVKAEVNCACSSSDCDAHSFPLRSPALPKVEDAQEEAEPLNQTESDDIDPSIRTHSAIHHWEPP
jgi:hypothetical protein